jgi:hypothetical protein
MHWEHSCAAGCTGLSRVAVLKRSKVRKGAETSCVEAEWEEGSYTSWSEPSEFYLIPQRPETIKRGEG